MSVGRPKILSKLGATDFVYELAKRGKTPAVIAREVHRVFGHPVSRDTIARELRRRPPETRSEPTAATPIRQRSRLLGDDIEVARQLADELRELAHGDFKPTDRRERRQALTAALEARILIAELFSASGRGTGEELH